MIRTTLSMILPILALSLAVPANAQYAAATPLPVAHPVTVPLASLTPYKWRMRKGDWGEAVVTSQYNRRGFQVRSIKSPGGQGIDCLALKRAPDGKLLDFKIGEVKTVRRGNARPAKTTRGPQLSRKWLAAKLKGMRASGPEMKKLALELDRFIKRSERAIDSFAEFLIVHEGTGRITRKDVLGRTISEAPIKDQLLWTMRNGWDRDWRRWARKSLRNQARISSATMGGTFRQAGLLKRLSKAAGPIGLAIGIAMDAHEVGSHYSAYHRGDIDQRTMVTQVSRSTGGIVGAGAGAFAGAKAGAAIGSLGGPAAPVSAPVGAAVGTLVGAVLGYQAGSSVGAGLAATWYDQIDTEIKLGVESWMINTSPPTIGAIR